jgi:hypothetical protein
VTTDARPGEDFVAALTAEIRGVLGECLVGLYACGSWVTGGFDAGVSDLDLVAVTSPEVDSIDLAGLERMHRRVTGRHSEWTDRLEIVYVGRETLWSFRTSLGSLAVISPGEAFHVREERVAEWLQNWYLVRETGVRLFGADVREVVPAIAWAEFVAATVRYADEVRDRSRLGVGGSVLAYTVLTMCRTFRTVRTQTLGSKQDGAAWTSERMPEWAWLIDTALACRLARGEVGFEDERSRAAAEMFVALLAAEIHAPVGPD